jgi:hypothetical protein
MCFTFVCLIIVFCTVFYVLSYVVSFVPEVMDREISFYFPHKFPFLFSSSVCNAPLKPSKKTIFAT